MTDLILNRWPRFSNFLAPYTAKLGKAATQHFIHLLIAFIIYDGAKNLTGLNRALGNPRHLSSVDRFLTEVVWDEAAFEQIRFEDLCRRARRYLHNHRAKGQKVPIFLCIDDTNNPKAGDKTLGVSLQYSHLQRRLVLSYSLVTAVLVIGHNVIPLNFQLYRRLDELTARGQQAQFCDKPTLAARLIEQWQLFEQTEPFVLVDSWYASPQVLAVCAKRNFTLITGLASNRSIKPEFATKYRQLKAYRQQLPNEAFHSVTVGARRWQLMSVVASLKSGQVGKIVVAKQVASSQSDRYWFCSDQKLSTQLIMEYYSVRWEIETFHKQAKQLLGWCDNQCHLEHTVRRLWTLLMIAYSYLSIEREEHADEYDHFRGCVLPTLWQVQQKHKHLAHQAQATYFYQQALLGVPLDDLLVKVRC